MVDRAKQDPVFKEYLRGRHQAIMTGKIFGVPFKCKFDALREDRIVDLKTVKDLKMEWIYETGNAAYAQYHEEPLDQENDGVLLVIRLRIRRRIRKTVFPRLVEILCPHCVFNCLRGA